jgi:hypothetical protein
MSSVKVLLTSLADMYKFFRNILFLFPPEWTHYFSMNCLKLFCSIGFIRKLLTESYKPQAVIDLKFEIWNLKLDRKLEIWIGVGLEMGLSGILCVGLSMRNSNAPTFEEVSYAT